MIIIIYHTLFAFVDVFGTIDPFVAGSTRTSVRTIDRTCVAYGIGVTRVGRARVVKVAQETCEKRQNFVISHCAKLCVDDRQNTIIQYTGDRYPVIRAVYNKQNGCP